MDVDSGIENDIADSSEPTTTDTSTAPDTGTLEAADPGSSDAFGAPDSAQTVDQTQQTSEQATRRAPEAAQPGATKTANPNPQNIPDDHRKALLDEKAQWGRERAQMRAEVETLRKSQAEIERHRAVQQQEAERQNLKPWHPKHHESTRNRERIQGVKSFKNALSAATPEQQADPNYRSNLARSMGVTQADAQLHDDWEAHRDATVNEMAQDPESYIDTRAERKAIAVVERALAQFQNHMQATAEVQRDLGDIEAIKPYAPLLTQVLKEGVPYPHAMRMIAMQRELDGLKAGAGASQQARQAADERARLAKGQAAITRDPRSGGLPDLYDMATKEAAKLGIATDSPKFMKIISRLEQSLKTP